MQEYFHSIDFDEKENKNAQSSLNDVNDAIAKICYEKNKRIVEEYLGDQNDEFESFSRRNLKHGN